MQMFIDKKGELYLCILIRYTLIGCIAIRLKKMVIM